MPVKIKCKNCEKILSVPDAARGKAIKCPACQTRLAVPAEPSSAKSSSAKSSKAKPKKEIERIESEEDLAKLDMSRAEDMNARICVKCGYDMQYQDEEETECPQCGFDAEVGGIGAKARKKAMRGPDPADFYPGLFTKSLEFVVKNYVLAWRTVMYTLVSLSLALFFAFTYLYLSMWPTRIFMALCFTISFLVIPGWMWFLDTEIIKLTLERKDKFKKLRFDFFLSSALGATSIIWFCVFAAPLILLPAALGYFFLDRIGGPAEVVLPVCAVIGLLPSIWMLPVVMAHMSMPVQYRGWMLWKMFPAAIQTVKPLMVWMLFFVVTNIPSVAGIAAIAYFYGADIRTIVVTMETNADINRQLFNLRENPNTKKKGQAAPVPPKIDNPKNVDFKPLIVPGVILAAMCVLNGFSSIFNMRTNGQFVYYNKNSLDLVDRKKDYKYIAKEKTDEDADEKPKTIYQLVGDALVFFLVFDLLGLVFGMLYGSTLMSGKWLATYNGLCIGHSISWFILYIQCIMYAFHTSLLWAAITVFGLHPVGFFVYVFKDWENRKDMGVKVATGFAISILLSTFSMIIYLSSGDSTVRGAAVQEFQQPPAAEKVEEAKPENQAQEKPVQSVAPAQP